VCGVRDAYRRRRGVILGIVLVLAALLRAPHSCGGRSYGSRLIAEYSSPLALPASAPPEAKLIHSDRGAAASGRPDKKTGLGGRVALTEADLRHFDLQWGVNLMSTMLAAWTDRPELGP